MSARTPAAGIVSRYAAGYFPLYDVDDHFYWERLPIRSIIELTEETGARAKKLAQRPRKKFHIRYTTSVDEVLKRLSDPAVKPHTWVRAEVLGIYRTLHAAGLLQTVEAYDVSNNALVGGLVGLVLPGTFIAETMFSLVPDASKFCLCQLVLDAQAAGHHMIDVQTPHDLDDLPPFGRPVKSVDKTPHPCIRLGEKTIGIATFMRRFHAGVAATFPGSIHDWLNVAAALVHPSAANADQFRNSALLRAAIPMLKNNHPAERPNEAPT